LPSGSNEGSAELESSRLKDPEVTAKHLFALALVGIADAIRFLVTKAKAFDGSDLKVGWFYENTLCGLFTASLLIITANNPISLFAVVGCQMYLDISDALGHNLGRGLAHYRNQLSMLIKTYMILNSKQVLLKPLDGESAEQIKRTSQSSVQELMEALPLLSANYVQSVMHVTIPQIYAHLSTTFTWRCASAIYTGLRRYGKMETQWPDMDFFLRQHPDDMSDPTASIDVEAFARHFDYSLGAAPRARGGIHARPSLPRRSEMPLRTFSPTSAFY
jgi:hypothetical protein